LDATIAELEDLLGRFRVQGRAPSQLTKKSTRPVRLELDAPGAREGDRLTGAILDDQQVVGQ